MNFEFATATRILFGSGVLKEVGPLAAELGRRALVVTGATTERARPLQGLLEAEGVETTFFAVPGEPTTAMAQDGVLHAKERGCDLVIAMGGGSAIDAGKAIAALLTHDGSVLDYLEVIGQGQPLTRPSVPFVAVPTTAGTGAEVTRNAVLVSPEHGVKVSLRSRWMLPRVAVIDPAQTRTLPPSTTASTGLDALTQVIEPFVSPKANPLTDIFCREGVRRAARSLRRACDNGKDLEARTDMALVSLLSGLALANAGLGAVHGFAAAIGGVFPAPHGVVCARLLPAVMEANVQALRARFAASPVLGRYEEVARLLTGHSVATAEDGITWVRELSAALPLLPLAEFGLTEDDFPAVVERSRAASSMKGNPVMLTNEELHTILTRALHARESVVHT